MVRPGLSDEEAASLLHDASRIKYEAWTSDVLSLNRSACLVISGSARGQPQQLVSLDALAKQAMLSFVPETRQFVNLVSVRSMKRLDAPLLRRCRWPLRGRRWQIGVGIPVGVSTRRRGDGANGVHNGLSFGSRMLLDALGHAVPLYERLIGAPLRERIATPLLDDAFFFPLLLRGNTKAVVSTLSGAPRHRCGL